MGSTLLKFLHAGSFFRKEHSIYIHLIILYSIVRTLSGIVRLPCAAEGYPPPSIIWRRNKLTINEDAKFTILPGGTLLLNNFNPDSDDGVYECSAFNDHGFVTADAIIIGENNIKVIPTETADNDVVLSAFSQAKLDVEAAENETLEILFGNMSKLGTLGAGCSEHINFECLFVVFQSISL